ncbi:MAG: 17 kDa surface antigen [Ramlibacter sp.]|nr:17 kDa surface antigen [Ramlibacter sp.]
MNLKLKSTLGIAALVLGTHAMAQVTFYEGEGFRGRAFTTDRSVADFQRFGFNDRAASVVVDRGRWEACEDSRFGGRCVVLRRGSYDSLQSLGMTNRISSVRPIQGNRNVAAEVPAPMVTPNYDYYRRPNERVFDAPVTSVRAVVGPPNQRCWVERQQVQQVQPNGQTNVGGVLLGGLIGGVLGHQVGGGSGKDLATVAGAVGGAVVGNNLAGGNNGVGPVGRDVQRCEATQSATPAYWDVTYNYRGMEHHVQMSAPPAGSTIAVNGNGEPRQ